MTGNVSLTCNGSFPLPSKLSSPFDHLWTPLLKFRSSMGPSSSFLLHGCISTLACGFLHQETQPNGWPSFPTSVSFGYFCGSSSPTISSFFPNALDAFPLFTFQAPFFPSSSHHIMLLLLSCDSQGPKAFLDIEQECQEQLLLEF